MAFSVRKLVMRPFRPSAPVIGVLRLSGVIGAAGRFRGGVNMAALAGPIEQLFRISGLTAVALVVNSPGGSPVQSAQIARRIRDLADEKSVPVFAFAEDVAASGGYMLTLAADEIYADPSSIIGSIGVISAGFGFQNLISKLGIERRVHTAGEHKGMLDPFRPEDPDDAAHLEMLQKEVHEVFKSLVRERREGRLKGEEAQLFSGRFWSGGRAVELGLIDGLGDIRTVMRERYGEKARLKVVGTEQSVLKRLFGGSESRQPHMPAAEEWLMGLEARALWGRFGL
ncbi:MAG: S49 family peptidase [Alphaproteobacteria bacterium]